LISRFATKPLRRHRGFSLVEAAIVLGVFSIIVSALWAVVGSVREKVRQEQAFEQIVMVVNNVRAFYKGQAGISGGYPTLTNDLLVNQVIPPDMHRPGTAAPGMLADHPWGPVGSAAATGGFLVRAEGDHQSFRIRLLGLKRDSCIAMAMKLGPTKGATGLQSVGINANTLSPPVSLASASARCNVTASSGNRVEFVFRLRQPSH